MGRLYYGKRTQVPPHQMPRYSEKTEFADTPEVPAIPDHVGFFGVGAFPDGPAHYEEVNLM